MIEEKAFECSFQSGLIAVLLSEQFDEISENFDVTRFQRKRLREARQMQGIASVQFLVTVHEVMEHISEQTAISD